MANPQLKPTQNNPGYSNSGTYDTFSKDRINNPNPPYYVLPNMPDMSYYDSDYRGLNHASSQITGDHSDVFPIANSQISHYGQSGAEHMRPQSDAPSQQKVYKTATVVKDQPSPIQRPEEMEPQTNSRHEDWNQPKLENHVVKEQEPVAVENTPEKTLQRVRPYPSAGTERPVESRLRISVPEKNTGSLQQQEQAEQVHGYEQYNNHPHQIQRKPGVESMRPQNKEDPRPVSGNMEKQELVHDGQSDIQQPGPYLKNTAIKSKEYQNGGSASGWKPDVGGSRVNSDASQVKSGDYGNYNIYESNKHDYNNNFNQNNYNPVLEQQKQHLEMFEGNSSPIVRPQDNEKQGSIQQNVYAGSYMNAGSGQRPLSQSNRIGYHSSGSLTTLPPPVKTVTKARFDQPAYKHSMSSKISGKSHPGYSTEGGIVRGGNEEKHRKISDWSDSGKSENSHRNRYPPEPHVDYNDNTFNQQGDTYWNSPYFTGSNNNNGMQGNMYHYYDPSAEFQNKGYFPRPDYAYYNIDQGIPSRLFIVLCYGRY